MAQGRGQGRQGPASGLDVGLSDGRLSDGRITYILYICIYAYMYLSMYSFIDIGLSDGRLSDERIIDTYIYIYTYFSFLCIQSLRTYIYVYIYVYSAYIHR